MTLAKITIEAGDVALEVVRANVSVTPVRRIGEIVNMPPGMKLEFVVNSFQGIVVREVSSDGLSIGG